MGYLGKLRFRRAHSVTGFGNSVPVHNLEDDSRCTLSTIGYGSGEWATNGRSNVNMWGFGRFRSSY